MCRHFDNPPHIIFRSISYNCCSFTISCLCFFLRARYEQIFVFLSNQILCKQCWTVLNKQACANSYQQTTNLHLNKKTTATNVELLEGMRKKLGWKKETVCKNGELHMTARTRGHVSRVLLLLLLWTERRAGNNKNTCAAAVFPITGDFKGLKYSRHLSKLVLCDTLHALPAVSVLWGPH